MRGQHDSVLRINSDVTCRALIECHLKGHQVRGTLCRPPDLMSNAHWTRCNCRMGGTLLSRDMIRVLRIDDGVVSFVIEAPNPELALHMGPIRDAVEAIVARLPALL